MSNLHLHVFHARPKSYYINWGTYIAISLNFALSIFTLRSADTRKGLSLDFDLDRDLDFDLDFLR